MLARTEHVQCKLVGSHRAVWMLEPVISLATSLGWASVKHLQVIKAGKCAAPDIDVPSMQADVYLRAVQQQYIDLSPLDQ